MAAIIFRGTALMGSAKPVDTKLGLNDHRHTIAEVHVHHVPPRDLPAVFNAIRARPKTRFSGGLRARWKSPDGTIYEWDYLHGNVEKFDKRGNHLSEHDASTGSQVSGPDSTKRVTP